ncbi:MAG TPA: enolase C-terminal domain-like protein, partial [Candidatus Thermoplasmatota archaeon]|nr:enolase C-terminal domain-like protein [Candidatus Thermoplasmatota archaeon]
VPPAEAAEAASNAVAAGFRTIKVKSDGDPRNDLARLQAIRAAVGAEPRLRVDANEAWDPATALGHLRSLEPFGVEYVEQPVRAGRFQDLVDLARSSPVPIALDESMTGWPVVERFLEAGTRPVLILKPQRLGGPDHVLEVIESARKARLACVVTNSLETAVGRAHALHLASLLPQPLPDCGLATEGFLAADAAPGPRTRDGVQELPAAPGIGVDPQVEPHARHVRG